MSRSPLSILILQTGEALPAVKERRGGFRELFHAGLTQGLVAAQVELRVLDVTERAEGDPVVALEGVDGVVMTGSAAMVGDDTSWMRWGVKAINRAVDEHVPFLGVCFGHQLLGVARGADVGPNPRGREVGTVEVEAFGTHGDALLHGLEGRFRAQVSHRDAIRDPGPRLEVLGRAPHDVAHIVRAGPWAWGVQFHPEFDDDVVREYIRGRRDLIDEAHGPGAAAAREASVVPTPEAVTVLHRFVRACEARRAARGDELAPSSPKEGLRAG